MGSWRRGVHRRPSSRPEALPRFLRAAARGARPGPRSLDVRMPWHSRPAHRTQIRPGGCATLQHAAWKHCTVTSEPTRSRSRWTRCRREISKATNATCHKKRGAASSSSNRPTRKTHTVSAPRATARASGITCVLLGPGPHRDRGGRCFVLPGLGFCEVAGLQVYGGRPWAGAGSDVRRLHAAMTSTSRSRSRGHPRQTRVAIGHRRPQRRCLAPPAADAPAAP